MSKYEKPYLQLATELEATKVEGTFLLMPMITPTATPNTLIVPATQIVVIPAKNN